MADVDEGSGTGPSTTLTQGRPPLRGAGRGIRPCPSADEVERRVREVRDEAFRLVGGPVARTGDIVSYDLDILPASSDVLLLAHNVAAGQSMRRVRPGGGLRLAQSGVHVACTLEATRR